MTSPNRRPSAPGLLLASGLTSLLALASCGSRDKGSLTEAAEGGVQKREIPSVRVAPVEVREMARVLETTSKLESELEIQVLPRVAGVVLELLAEEGDAVAQGDALAVLDDLQQALAVKDAEVAWHESKNTLDKLSLAVRESEARVNRTQLAREQARRDFERNQKLFEGATVASGLSKSALEASQLARDNADADHLDAELSRERAKLELAAGETAVERTAINLERSRLDLTYTRISAPFSGVIAQRNVKVGDSIGPSTVAFVLTDISALRAVFSRPQEELELFAQVGTTNGDGRLAVSATADAFPGRTFTGWIERVSPTIDPQSGQFRVTGRLAGVQENGRVRLLPGMLVRLRIVTDRHPSALVVPKRALEREGERRYLLIADPDPAAGERRASVRRVEIVEGFADEEFIEVEPRADARLVAGDAVIVVGGRDLAAGDAIEVDEERTDEATAAEPPAAQGTAETR